MRIKLVLMNTRIFTLPKYTSLSVNSEFVNFYKSQRTFMHALPLKGIAKYYI